MSSILKQIRGRSSYPPEGTRSVDCYRELQRPRNAVGQMFVCVRSDQENLETAENSTAAGEMSED